MEIVFMAPVRLQRPPAMDDSAQFDTSRAWHGLYPHFENSERMCAMGRVAAI